MLPRVEVKPVAEGEVAKVPDVVEGAKPVADAPVEGVPVAEADKPDTIESLQAKLTTANAALETETAGRSKDNADYRANQIQALKWKDVGDEVKLMREHMEIITEHQNKGTTDKIAGDIAEHDRKRGVTQATEQFKTEFDAVMAESGVLAGKLGIEDPNKHDDFQAALGFLNQAQSTGERYWVEKVRTELATIEMKHGVATNQTATTKQIEDARKEGAQAALNGSDALNVDAGGGAGGGGEAEWRSLSPEGKLEYAKRQGKTLATIS